MTRSMAAIHRLRRYRRTAAAVAAAAGLLLLAGCGGGGSSAGSDGSSSASGSTSARSAVAYAACMRNHGVPNYPDPDSHGNLTKKGAQQLGVSDSQLQSARRACQHLLPNAGGVLNPDSFRQCMLAGDCPRRWCSRR
jgi:hypothetical protein